MEVQSAVHKRLGPSGRIRLAIEMCDFARRSAISGIRTLHPEYSQAEAVKALVLQLYGVRLDRL
jgi:hypothetical protein